jgi:hypothetical protein
MTTLLLLYIISTGQLHISHHDTMEECLKVKAFAERTLHVKAGCFAGTSFRIKLDEFIRQKLSKSDSMWNKNQLTGDKL